MKFIFDKLSFLSHWQQIYLTQLWMLKVQQSFKQTTLANQTFHTKHEQAIITMTIVTFLHSIY